MSVPKIDKVQEKVPAVQEWFDGLGPSTKEAARKWLFALDENRAAQPSQKASRAFNRWDGHRVEFTAAALLLLDGQQVQNATIPHAYRVFTGKAYNSRVLSQVARAMGTKLLPNKLGQSAGVLRETAWRAVQTDADGVKQVVVRSLPPNLPEFVQEMLERGIRVVIDPDASQEAAA